MTTAPAAPLSPLEELLEAIRGHWTSVQPLLEAVAASPRYQTVLTAQRVGQERQCRDALSMLDTALDDAEATYYDALEDERYRWGTVGQHAVRWQLWAALTPGLTWPDVAGAAALILQWRDACDWTQEEAAAIAAGLLEGWLARTY